MRTLTVFLFWAWAAHSADAVTLLRGKEASRSTETLKRSKRGWMWKQFFLQEEYTGTDNQYIGKVGKRFHAGYTLKIDSKVCTRFLGWNMKPQAVITPCWYSFTETAPLRTFLSLC